MGPYEYVIASLEGPVWAPADSWSQTSKLWVVALPKFFTPAQSMTIHAKPPPVRVATRIAPAPDADGLRSLQRGAMELFGRAAFGKCCGVNTMSPLSPPPTTM